MALSHRLRSSIAIGALVGAVTVCPDAAVFADDRPEPATGNGQALDLGDVLAPDGSFRGVTGVSGSVDAAGWTLVSDLSRGEAPRFARSKRTPRSAAVGAWAAVGPSGGNSALNHDVLALTPTSHKLYVGGDFYNTLGATGADSLGVWDGSTWSAVEGNDLFGGNAVAAIAVDGHDIYVGGTFSNAAGIAAADHIVMWDDSASSWSALGPGLNGEVHAIAISGNDVYVGGDFTEADNIPAADYVARWDGSWHKMGIHNGNGVLADQVYALAVSGSDVYAGGLFTNADGDPTADYLAKWDGSSWSNLGSNPAGTNGALSDTVEALRFQGRSLYVGGNFQNVAGIATADYVARWRGGAWGGLGSNGSGNGAIGGRVYALALAGTDLYAGGQFFDVAGIPEADGVALWDGSAWSALGSNGSGDGALDNTVRALAVFDRELYVGGQFHDAAGIPEADYVASWGLTHVRLPDGRVRPGTSGSYTGNDIYNTSADHQKVTRTGARGATLVYQVSIQNDSPTNSDRFTIAASGAATSYYTVKYFRGSTNITADVVAGTYQTTSLARGASTVIKVQIKVKNNAPANSKVSRKLTLTSVGDPTKRDAVKVVGKHWSPDRHPDATSMPSERVAMDMLRAIASAHARPPSPHERRRWNGSDTAQPGESVADDRISPSSTDDSRPGAFAAAFDGDSPGGIEPYVRLLPSDGNEAGTTGHESLTGERRVESRGRAMFRPEDIEGRDYRLLARALTNEDGDTHHLAAMTLVQLVKFLRAAGVSVPDFPESGSVPDPAAVSIHEPAPAPVMSETLRSRVAQGS